MPLVFAHLRHLLIAGTLVAGACQPSTAPTRSDPVQSLLAAYRATSEPADRARLLRELSKTGDPRAAVALGEAMDDVSLDVRVEAVVGLMDHFHDGPLWSGGLETHFIRVRSWWEENEPRFRQKAAGLEAAANPPTMNPR